MRKNAPRRKKMNLRRATMRRKGICINASFRSAFASDLTFKLRWRQESPGPGGRAGCSYSTKGSITSLRGEGGLKRIVGSIFRRLLGALMGFLSAGVVCFLIIVAAMVFCRSTFGVRGI